MLSTGKSCLTETGYRPKFCKVYITATGAPFIFRLAKEFAKQYFLFNSFTKLGADLWRNNHEPRSVTSDVQAQPNVSAVTYTIKCSSGVVLAIYVRSVETNASIEAALKI